MDFAQSAFDALIRLGELLKTEEFSGRLGWTRQQLSNAVGACRLFCVSVGDVRAYPAFYLDARYDRRELERVIEALGDLSGGSKWLFFTKQKGSLSEPLAGSLTALSRAGHAVTPPFPKSDTYLGPSGLPRMPLQALEAGELARVLQAASEYAER